MRVWVDARIDSRGVCIPRDPSASHSMMSLPDDLMAKILNASDQTARASALVVNKSMNRVVSTCSDVWTEITFRKLGAREREFFIARQIQKLSLDGVIPEEVQHLFRAASNDLRRLFSRAAAFDRLETLDVKIADVVRLPFDFGTTHMALLPQLRHLRITTSEIERECTFVVSGGFERLESFEFHELGSSPMVDVSFHEWNFPNLRQVSITCDHTNFADNAVCVSTLERLSLRPYYATFETARWGPLDFLELNIAENTDDYALSRIRAVKHLVLRVTESAYLNFRVPSSVERITFLLAASDCLLEFEHAATREARTVRIVGEHEPMLAPWNVIVHGTDFRSIREFCSKTDVGDDILMNFVNVTA